MKIRKILYTGFIGIVGTTFVGLAGWLAYLKHFDTEVKYVSGELPAGEIEISDLQVEYDLADGELQQDTILSSNDHYAVQNALLGAFEKKDRKKHSSGNKTAKQYVLEVYQQKYIDDMTQIVKDEAKKIGCPPSIKMAQAILESKWGQSSLATQGNNHFGIKWKKGDKSDGVIVKGICKKTTKEVKNGKTITVKADFVRYHNRWASFRGHTHFLKKRIETNPKYAPMKNLSSTDYKGWAVALGKSGYATQPDYADRLINVIERYELYKLDK